MKVLIVFHDSNKSSGATRSMLDLMGTWRDYAGFELTAMFPSTGTALEVTENLGIKNIVFKYYNVRTEISSNCWTRKKAALKRYISIINALPLIKKLKAEHFDYIYSNTGAIYIGYDLSKILQVKHIWHIREFGALDQERMCYDGEKKFCEKLNDSKEVIAISNAIKQYLLSIGVDDSRISVIYNDVHSDILYEKDLNSNISEINILSCGGIQKNKGHLDVIKAVELLKDKYKIKLFIAGNSQMPYFSVLDDYVKAHNLGNIVTFCGFVRNMKELRNICSIAVIASSNEAFGRVTIEGMQGKMLVIGANAGGTAELIFNKKNGLLYPAGDFKELSNCIEYAVNNWHYMNEVIECGFEYAMQFNCGKAAKKIFNLLQ